MDELHEEFDLDDTLSISEILCSVEEYRRPEKKPGFKVSLNGIQKYIIP